MPFILGAMFTGLCIFSWVMYFWVDGDSGRAVVCTAFFVVFAGPLFFGTLLALRGRRFGLYLLRFGSLFFILNLDIMIIVSLWQLEYDPQYIDWLSRRGRHVV